MRSITKFGISIVWLTFSDETDTSFARAQVNERLTLVRDRIPAEFGRPELGPISTGLGEIYMFELSSKGPKRSQEELRTIVEWQVAPRLRQVPGVVEVVAFGGSLKQYRVTLDPARLAAHSLSIDQVRAALSRDNAVSGGGSIEANGEQVVLSGDARFRGLEDIAAVVVRTDENGPPIRVGHLGKVDTGPALRQGAMTRDGRGEIVGGSVLLLKGENSREVVTRVKERITEIGPMLPEGVSIEPYYDRAEFINGVIATITKNLSEGALITVACLLLTLGSLRAGLLVAGAIPFSLLIGFIGLKVSGYSGNVMSLGAVDFGIIVEGTVLVVEHALAHATGNRDPRERVERLLAAMKEVVRPAVFGVTITLLVFLPLASLSGIEGKMFRPVVMSLVFMLAIIALMLAITFGKPRYAVVTLLNLPFALTGGVAALWLRGLPFSIPAAVGFIALCGVSVMTGIVMTTNLLALPGKTDLVARVRSSALSSLRVVSSTALIAAVGFLPAALATGKGAEVQRPLATVVIGGLLLSILISLPTLPSMLLVAARLGTGKKSAPQETDEPVP